MRVFVLFSLVAIALGASTTIFTTTSAEESCLDGACTSIKTCLNHDGVIQDSSLCTCPEVYCCYSTLSTTTESSSIETTSSTESTSSSSTASSEQTSTSSEASSSSVNTIAVSEESSSEVPIETTNVESEESSSFSIVESSLSSSSSSEVPTATTNVESKESSTVTTSVELEETSPSSSSSEVPTTTTNEVMEESSSETTTTPITYTFSAEKLKAFSNFPTVEDTSVSETNVSDCTPWVCLTQEECDNLDGIEITNTDTCLEPYTKCCFPNN